MKRILPKSIDILAERLSRLPSIGPKTAHRLAFVMLQRPDSFLHELSDAISGLKKNLHPCPTCFLITDEEGQCVICQDSSRNTTILCVVEEPLDVVALESSHSFKGYYHVLGGVLSPLEGVGPDQLRIRELVERVEANPNLREVIIATNPSLEGEATALYIGDRLKTLPVHVSRIARGLPTGGSLEYADEITLQRALEGRQEYRKEEE